MKQKPPRPATDQTSMPSMPRAVTLYSDSAQRVLKRHAGALGPIMNSISVITRLIGNAEHARQAEKIISNILNSIDEDVSKEIAEMEQKIHAANITGNAVYSHPRESVIDIMDSEQDHFVDLVVAADTLFKHLFILKVKREITADQEHDRNQYWQKRLSQAASEIRKFSEDLKTGAVKREAEKAKTAAPPELLSDVYTEPLFKAPTNTEKPKSAAA